MDLITRKEAFNKLVDNIEFKLKTETIELKDAADRVLAEDVYCKQPIPMSQSARLDGIAAKLEDLMACRYEGKQLKLGEDFDYVDTGDDVPDKYDWCLAIESVEVVDGYLQIAERINPKEEHYIKEKGSVVSENELMLSKGTLINPLNIMLLAMGGHERIEVYKKLVVAYIPTGNELVKVGRELVRGEYYEANSYMIRAFVEKLQGEFVITDIIKDNIDSLISAINEVMELADIVIITGGSSLGRDDLNVKYLMETGAMLQHGVTCAPGYPIGFAQIDKKPVINLPGPPLASFMGMTWIINRLIGIYYFGEISEPKKVTAELKEDISKRINWEMLALVELTVDAEGKYYAAPLNRVRKYPITMEFSKANGIFEMPHGPREYKKGDVIEVIPIETSLSDYKLKGFD